MVRIEMTVRDDRAQRLTTYDLLAWLMWPFDLLFIVVDAMTEAHRLIISGSCLVTTGDYVKSYFIPAGMSGHPSRFRNMQTTTFAPFRRVVSYESRADYRHAVEHRGDDKPSLIAAGSARKKERDR